MTDAPPTQETPRQRHPERKATPARKKPRKPRPDADAQLLQEIIEAMITAMPAGLTWAAGRLGLTVSNARKRLHSPRGAFDPASLRAAFLVSGSRADRYDGQQPLRSATVGRFVIDLHQTPEGVTPTWRIAE